MFTTKQNTPITIDLRVQANSRGWYVSDGKAIHESCNAGNIDLTGKTITAGETWTFSYRIVSISGSYVQAFLGDTAGVQRVSAGNYSETLVATGTTPVLRFYCPATTDCVVDIFNIQKQDQSTALKQQNTTAFSEENNKWNPHYTYVPDCGFSLFTKMVTFKGGQPWIHKNTITPRNNFYGVQYKSILKPVFNMNKGEVKTFQSLTIQANQILITTENGVTTSLGQVSELIESDFLQETLIGTSNIEVYDKEGIFISGFLRDKNIDLLDGPHLKGNYIAVEIQTVNAGKLRLLTVGVSSVPSKNGTRN